MGSNLTPILQAVKEILSSAGRKGMHVSKISQAAVNENKNMGLTAEEFKKKITAALAANLKLKRGKPSFAQVNWDSGPRKGNPRQGWYRVKEERVQPPETKISIPGVNSNFTGKAGEYAVMSELLFWGYNVSQMTVDDGIDLVANKNNKFFYIQVKTSMRQDGDKYTFTIAKNSFSKYKSHNAFYVFVLRQDTQNGYIIIQGNILDAFIMKGVIRDGNILSITITVNDKKTVYTLNNKENITHYFGRFGEIIL